MPGHLERIQAFLAVAEAQSFSAAARNLKASASAVTRNVADLEAELGTQLLVRTTRKVSLTQSGVAYFEKVAPLVADLEAADETARVAQTALRGSLRLSCPLSFGTRFLAPTIADMSDLHPEIELRVTLTDRFIDIIKDDYDMALRISSAPTDKSSIWRKIRPVPRVLVASPDYLSAAGSLERPEDLNQHRCLGYSNLAEGETWQLGRADGVMKPMRLTPAFQCNNGDLIADLACRAQGIALLPRFIVTDALNSRQLVEVLPDWSAPEIWLTAYYPPYQKLRAVLDRFTSVFESHAAKLPL